MKSLTPFMLGAASALSLIALASPAQASLNDQFGCQPVGDGEHLVIFDAFDSNKATVQYQIQSENALDAGPVVTPLRAKYNYPESGARYEGGDYILLTTNSTAVLIYGADSDEPGHTECTFIGGEPEDETGEATTGAAGEPIALDVAARSWGGKLRAGPGMKFAQTGSLQEGENVTLIENTGVMMNGYNWFKIRRAKGQEGYKWGGILCSNTRQVAGLFDQCME
jgi:Bacterial SH3 domain